MTDSHPDFSPSRTKHDFEYNSIKFPVLMNHFFSASVIVVVSIPPKTITQLLSQWTQKGLEGGVQGVGCILRYSAGFRFVIADATVRGKNFSQFRTSQIVEINSGFRGSCIPFHIPIRFVRVSCFLFHTKMCKVLFFFWDFSSTSFCILRLLFPSYLNHDYYFIIINV